MANPQIEDGFTRIAHEILDAICQYKFNGAQLRIVIKIWRLTYGFGRKDHDFSISFLSECTGLTDRTVKKELKALIDFGVLLETKKASWVASRKLSFNKDYELWTIGKSGDDMPEQIDLFDSEEGNDPSPPDDRGVGNNTSPGVGNNTSPGEGNDPSPIYRYKDIDIYIKDKRAMFDQFFKLYPRKTNKDYAIKTWEKHCKDKTFNPLDVICKTKNFADTCLLLETETKFIPHASTYLNQYRYNDYETVDPEGLSNRPATEYDRDKEMLQQMMREAEEREGDGRGQALLNHPD